MENEEIIVEETIEDSNLNAGEETENIEIIDNLELTDDSKETDPKIENVKTFTQDELDNIVEKRIAREKRKYEEQLNVYKPLVETLKQGGFETDDPKELVLKVRKSYEEQGVNIPEYKTELGEKEQKVLAQFDSEEVIGLGEDVMKERFTELYNKKDRTIREEQEMYLIGKEHSKRLAEKELLELGVEPKKIMNDANFKDFASKMNSNVPIKEIYTLYKKIKGIEVPKPISAGSIKSNSNNADSFTQAKIDAMSSAEMAKHWNNPEFRKIAGLD